MGQEEDTGQWAVTLWDDQPTREAPSELPDSEGLVYFPMDGLSQTPGDPSSSQSQPSLRQALKSPLDCAGAGAARTWQLYPG